jgi:hypothetical protein
MLLHGIHLSFVQCPIVQRYLHSIITCSTVADVQWHLCSMLSLCSRLNKVDHCSRLRFPLLTHEANVPYGSHERLKAFSAHTFLLISHKIWIRTAESFIYIWCAITRIFDVSLTGQRAANKFQAWMVTHMTQRNNPPSFLRNKWCNKLNILECPHACHPKRYKAIYWK